MSAVLWWFFTNVLWEAFAMSVPIRAALTWLFDVSLNRRKEIAFWLIVPSMVALMLMAISLNSGMLSKPDLKVAIMKANFAPMPNEPSSTSFLVEVAVRNVGTPSVVEDWAVSIEIPGQPAPVVGELLFMPDVMHLSGEKGMIEYSGEDAIYRKTAEQPIPTGGRVAGLLWCKLSDVKVETVRSPGVRVIVKYSDVNGNHYAISTPLSAVEGSPTYLPGLRPPGGAIRKEENKQ